ncbi:hypothetical protein [Megamonas funiformis]|uniref:hypothetical protein n=1 Tax=Megamonas funiformis TaxID=437897 RepID=UPI0022E00B5C|nr:hypothetical protein [Megamonas funiformis]
MWLKHLKTEVDVDDKVMFYVGIVTKYLKRGTITGFKKGYVQIRGENGYPYPYVLPEDITMLLTENSNDCYQENYTASSYDDYNDDSYNEDYYNNSPCVNAYDNDYDNSVNDNNSYSSSSYDSYSSSNDSSFDCSSSNDW